MIDELLALMALLARTLARNLTPSALARRRLKKSSIYLSCEWLTAMAAAGAGRCAVSANSADRCLAAGNGHGADTEGLMALLARAKCSCFLLGQEFDGIAFNEAGALSACPDTVVDIAGVYHRIRIDLLSALPKFVFQLGARRIPAEQRRLSNVALHVFDDSIRPIGDVFGCDWNASGHERGEGGRLNRHRIDVLKHRKRDEDGGIHLETVPFEPTYSSVAGLKSSNRTTFSREVIS